MVLVCRGTECCRGWRVIPEFMSCSHDKCSPSHTCGPSLPTNVGGRSPSETSEPSSSTGTPVSKARDIHGFHLQYHMELNSFKCYSSVLRKILGRRRNPARMGCPVGLSRGNAPCSACLGGPATLPHFVA